MSRPRPCAVIVRRCLGWLVVVAAGSVGGGAWASAAAGENDPPTAAEEARIAALIEQLGSTRFQEREQAGEDLKRIGLKAFDALRLALQHDDVEIVLRAKYLLHGLPENWAQASDSPLVQSYLREYRAHGPVEKETRINALGKLSGDEGVPALCRLTCYEADDILSLKSALALLRQKAPAAPPARQARAEQIRRSISGSNRIGIQWLRSYAKWLAAPAETIAELEAMVEDELLRRAAHPDQTDTAVSRGLVRWLAEVHQQEGRPELALHWARRSFGMLEGTENEMFDFATWADALRAPFLVLELQTRFPAQFRRSPPLTYLTAEAHWKLRDFPAAEAAAGRAREIESNLRDRVSTGYLLRSRGLHRWAEIEWRLVLDRTPLPSFENYMTRVFLRSMLRDLGLELASAELIRDFLDEHDRDPQRFPRSLSGKVAEQRGVMNYLLGLHYRQRGDPDRARSHQVAAIELMKAESPPPSEFLDVLIEAYQLSGADAPLRNQVRELLAKDVAEYRKNLHDLTEQLPLTTDPAEREAIIEEIATLNNNLAWLICNTEGDFQEALRMSRRSLELQPGSATYLDTLARCHYALGQRGEAVATQTAAVEADPAMRQLLHTLIDYETEFAAQR